MNMHDYVEIVSLLEAQRKEFEIRFANIETNSRESENRLKRELEELKEKVDENDTLDKKELELKMVADPRTKISTFDSEIINGLGSIYNRKTEVKDKNPAQTALVAEEEIGQIDNVADNENLIDMQFNTNTVQGTPRKSFVAACVYGKTGAITRNIGSPVNAEVSHTLDDKEKFSIRRYISRIEGFLGINSFYTMTDLNTGTVSMYAVAVVVDSDVHPIFKWSNSLGNLFLVSFQCYVLFDLLYEPVQDDEKQCITSGVPSIGKIMLIIFLSLLWALPITQDIEEAAIEEKVLNHNMKGPLNIPFEIVRLGLRAKRFVLPIFSTLATLSVLATEKVSATNLILNFLAITFICEADNLFALMFHRKNQKDMMKKTIRDFNICQPDGTAAISFWARCLTFFCVLLLIVGLIYTDTIIEIFTFKFFYDGKEDYCMELHFALLEVGYIALLFPFLGQELYILFTTREETMCSRIVTALIEFNRNVLTSNIVFAFVFFITLSEKSNSEDNIDSLQDRLFVWVLAILFGILLMIGLEVYKNKLLNRS